MSYTGCYTPVIACRFVSTMHSRLHSYIQEHLKSLDLHPMGIRDFFVHQHRETKECGSYQMVGLPFDLDSSLTKNECASVSAIIKKIKTEWME